MFLFSNRTKCRSESLTNLFFQGFKNLISATDCTKGACQRSTLIMASTSINSIVHFCSGCSIEMTLFGETPPNSDGESVKSFLTKCFHILCQKCRTKGGQQCVACNATTQYLPISRQMPQRYRSYFSQLPEMRTQLEKRAHFQSSQARLICSKFIIKRHRLKQKCADVKRLLVESKQKYQDIHDIKIKMEIILKTIRRWVKQIFWFRIENCRRNNSMDQFWMQMKTK